VIDQFVVEWRGEPVRSVKTVRDGHSHRRLALAIEAEWRKQVAGVVPAQPKARPEGQRPEYQFQRTKTAGKLR